MGRKVVVVGAGVVGLTIAWELLKKGYDVSVVGRYIPGDVNPDYVSPFAGANWASFASVDDKFSQDLDKAGYRNFLKFAATEPSAGIQRVKTHALIRRNELQKPKAWYLDGFVENVRKLSKDELPKDDNDIVTGYSFDSVTITTPIYLNFLLQKVFSLGGTLARRTLKHIDEAYDLHHTGKKAELVINATGLLSKYLKGVEDQDLFPVKGQIVRIGNNFKNQVMVSLKNHKIESFYAFPRKEGGGIVGGTFDIGNWTKNIDEDLTARIVSRIKTYIPELKDEEIDVIETYVGFRPMRKGGYRIERDGSIIHSYGLGGSGYQASFGVAEKVLELTDAYFRTSKL